MLIFVRILCIWKANLLRKAEWAVQRMRKRNRVLHEPQRQGDAEWRGELEFVSRKERKGWREEREESWKDMERSARFCIVLTCLLVVCCRVSLIYSEIRCLITHSCIGFVGLTVLGHTVKFVFNLYQFVVQ